MDPAPTYPLSLHDALPICLLVRVGMAAHVDEQRGVVDGSTRVVVQAGVVGQAQRDQALAQHVLHRLAEAEVDPQRERGDQLDRKSTRLNSSHMSISYAVFC